MSVLELAVLVLLRVFDLREEEWGVWGGIGSAWIPALACFREAWRCDLGSRAAGTFSLSMQLPSPLSCHVR